MARREDRQRDRRHHKNDGRPGGGFRQNRGSAAWSEGGLAAHASEGCGNVAALAALQQYYDNEKQTNRDVDERNQYDHERLKNPRSESSAGLDGPMPGKRISVAGLLYDAPAAEDKPTG
jgi:hypothetical protein